jgi:hypothetical protein
MRDVVEADAVHLLARCTAGNHHPRAMLLRCYGGAGATVRRCVPCRFLPGAALNCGPHTTKVTRGPDPVPSNLAPLAPFDARAGNTGIIAHHGRRGRTAWERGNG